MKLEGSVGLSQCPVSMTVKTFSPSNIICFCQPNTVRGAKETRTLAGQRSRKHSDSFLRRDSVKGAKDCELYRMEERAPNGTSSGAVTTLLWLAEASSVQCRGWPVVPDMVVAVRTVEGVQVDGEAVGLPEALSTVPTDIWLVPGVGPHMPGQLDRLGEHGIAVLACVHFPCKRT